MSTPLLCFENVYKTFSSKVVLQGVNLAVLPGESLVVIGGSGSGKSVMIKCALGLLEPERGRIQFDGVEMLTAGRKQHDAMLARVGMLFQGGALFDSLSVWENIAFSLIYREGVERKRAYEEAIRTLVKVRLGEDVAMLYPSEISGGMQKRVALARAVISKPDLIFFDEPTTGLDPITADAINDLILEQVRAIGSAAITITHDMSSARKIADRIAMLYEGKIIWQGTAREMETTDNPYVQQFINGRMDGPIKAVI